MLAAAVLAGGAYTAWRTHNSSTDFDTYYFAAKRIIGGEPLYKEISGLSPYIYPPFFACLLTPAAIIGLIPAAFLWYLLNIFLIFYSLRIVSALVFGDPDLVKNLGRVKFFPKAIALGITAAVFLDNLSLLQVNILIFVAVIAGAYLFSSGKNTAAAAAFAFAISVKLIPAVFVLYFLVKREFRLVCLIMLFAVIFSFAVPAISLGPAQAREAFTWWGNENFLKSTASPNFQMMDNMFNPENQSLTAFLSRWLVGNDSTVTYWKSVSHNYPVFIRNINFGLTAKQAVFTAKLVMAAMTLVTLVVCSGRRGGRGPGSANNEYSLIMLLSLLTTPILKTQYFVFVLLPVFVIANEDRKGGLLALSVFLAMYASQAVELFEIAGLGCLSVIFLWAVFLFRRALTVQAL